ncbi:hypothetical protein [Rheinheimera aquimaris]|uniref:hypothetical protein n=1 Tax=Rheinheimera aquimaris TaxID=412437 RepID=UPI003A97715B
MLFTSSDVKRYGPQKAADDCNQICLVLNPVKAEPWATFQSKIIAQSSISIADFNFSAEGESLVVTVSGKSNIDPSGEAADTDDLCVAIIDTVAQKVHIVQDVVDRVITNETDDTVNIPAMRIVFSELEAA